ncbi:MAG: hypothetical protein BWX84_03131 [Verrucomicrobia bacterium ADurb.Bin118]|nr:MAG: hypothetical protein BWX84_03131 [Verrucomicrobia bacterium ADurb.Bin118]
MTAQHQEEIRMALERVVNGRSLGAEVAGGGIAPRGMGDHHRAPVRVRRQHAVGPVQDGAAVAAILEVEYDEIQPANAEEIVVTVVVLAKIPAIPGPVAEMIPAEILVVKGGGAVRIIRRGLIVVTDGQTVRDAVGQQRPRGILQPVHRVGGVTPLGRVGLAALDVAILHDVAQVRDIDDVVRHPVGDDPLGLGEPHLLHRLSLCGRFAGVVLRIRQHHETKIRSGKRSRRFASIEGHREIARRGVGHGNTQIDGGAEVRRSRFRGQRRRREWIVTDHPEVIIRNHPRAAGARLVPNEITRRAVQPPSVRQIGIGARVVNPGPTAVERDLHPGMIVRPAFRAGIGHADQQGNFRPVGIRRQPDDRAVEIRHPGRSGINPFLQPVTGGRAVGAP